MANVNVTSNAWTEISITSGTVQNISATADIELSAEQTDNSGVVLKPSELYQWDNETIYARAVTEETGALRVVNFKKAAGGGGGYVLPVASASKLGGVKVGSNLSIDADGVISTHAPYSLPTAAAGTLGGIKVGYGLSINGSGVLSSTEGATVNYSTTEQEIGTWIDGNPLYQKTIYVGNLPNNGNLDITLGLPIDKMISMSGVAFDTGGTGYTFNIPRVRPDLIKDQVGIAYNGDASNQIRIFTAGDVSAMEAYVTIQYTKTTD